jgi:hypothetical protein
MKLTKNRFFFPVLGIIIGSALVSIGSGLAVQLNGKAPLFLAVGGGVFGISLSKLYYLLVGCFRARRRPALHRLQSIESRDERNILIRDKAGNKTNSLMLDLVFILTFVFAFMSVNLYITATMAGLMLVNIIAYTFFTRYYDKRL